MKKRDNVSILIGACNLLWSSFILPVYFHGRDWSMFIVASMGLLCGIVLLTLELPLLRKKEKNDEA